MAGKRDKPEVIIQKLRQAQVFQGQEASIVDAAPLVQELNAMLWARAERTIEALW